MLPTALAIPRWLYANLRRGLELVPGDMELRRMLAQDLSALGQHEER